MNIRLTNFSTFRQPNISLSSKKPADIRFCGVDEEKNIKNFLDKKTFEFKKSNGEVFNGTIKEFFENSIISSRSTKYLSLIHCTSTKDVAKDIIKNGLDWQKTSRTRCGPGVYFAPSVQVGIEQGAGSVPIEGTYIGEKESYPIFENRFYDSVTNNDDILNAVSKLTTDNPTKAINRYSHNLLCDDMGIDLLYASSGYGTGAYVVLNDECMELKPYYW